MPKAKRSHIGFKLENIEPRNDHAWELAGPLGRRAFWREAGRIGYEVKQRSIMRGLGVDGGPLKNISLYTRKHRKSAMTASGKGSPSAPPLVPGYTLSRTYSYLRYEIEEDGVYYWWKFDRHTGLPWGVILQYQAKQGRNTIGLSFDDWDAIIDHTDRWWAANRARLARLGAARAGMHPQAASPIFIGTKTPNRIDVPQVPPKLSPLLNIKLPNAAPVSPNQVRPVLNPMRGVVASASTHDLVNKSNAAGIFSGWHKPKPMPLGGILDRVLQRRKAK